MRRIIYGCWRNMIDRCENSRNKKYRIYGKRGISVYPEWKSFDLFYNWAISSGYKEGLTLDRINSNLGYNPVNCRWISLSDNSAITSKNVLTYDLAIKIHNLHNKGFSQRLIASKLNISKRPVQTILDGSHRIYSREL